MSRLLHLSVSGAHSPLSGGLSLRRLRWAFAGLGVILLAILGTLTGVAEQRLEESQKEREEMVASRIFDEMEREISAFLELENERPHYAELGQTNPETWAPFVVGYFSGARAGSASSAQVVVAERNSEEDQRRINWALTQAGDNLGANIDLSPKAPSLAPPQVSPSAPSRGIQMPSPVPSAVAPSPAGRPAEEGAKTDVTAPVTQSKSASDREIIESLNRAPERRKSKSGSQNNSNSEDPFSDYSRSY